MQYNYYIRCWKDDENISRTGKGQGIHYQHFWEESLWDNIFYFGASMCLTEHLP